MNISVNSLRISVGNINEKSIQITRPDSEIGSADPAPCRLK